MGQQISAKPNTKHTTLRQTKMAIPGIENKFLDFERSNFVLSPKLEIIDFFFAYTSVPLRFPNLTNPVIFCIS
jgi:hypothetical protein